MAVSKPRHIAPDDHVKLAQHKLDRIKRLFD